LKDGKEVFLGVRISLSEAKVDCGLDTVKRHGAEDS